MLSAIKDPNPVMYLYPKMLIRAKGEELIPGEPADDKKLREMIDAPTGATLYHVEEARDGWQPNWPEGLTDYTVPIGKARIVRPGSDVTIVTYSRHVVLAQQAAKTLASEGINTEIIDLRTLYPWDRDTVMASVRKTGRVLVLNEDTPVTNFGEHILREIVDTCFYELVAKPRLLAGADVPAIGLHPNLEDASVPQVHEIISLVRDIAKEAP